MKISSVKVFVVGNPPPHFGGRYWIFLKLTTDGGVEGIGEVYSVPCHPSVVTQMINDVASSVRTRLSWKNSGGLSTRALSPSVPIPPFSAS